MRLWAALRDGNCLFRSCGHLLGIDHVKLRSKVCHILECHQNMKIGDLTIEEWLKISDYPVNYINELKKEGVFGDALCLSIISQLWERTIIVLDEHGNKITDIFPEWGMPIYLKYSNGNHYDALIPEI